MIDKTGYLKLIDFGIAKDLKNKELTNTICGTPHYLAPEVIMGKGYSFSSDYWSIGVTMFEIFLWVCSLRTKLKRRNGCIL